MATTVINITKEVIESQKLSEGFSISVDTTGVIIITPQAVKEVREGWTKMIRNHQTDINDDPYLQDWIAADAYLLTPID